MVLNALDDMASDNWQALSAGAVGDISFCAAPEHEIDEVGRCIVTPG